MTAQPLAFGDGSALQTLIGSPNLTWDDATGTFYVNTQPVVPFIDTNSSHLIYISPQGTDTADTTGTIAQPYKTFMYAQNTITDLSKKTTILAMPGTYPDPVTWYPNVFCLGFSADQVRFTGTIDVNSAHWATYPNGISGVQNLQLMGAITIDFSAHATTSAQFVMLGGIQQAPLVYTANSAGDQFVAVNTLLLYPITLNGGGQAVLVGISQVFSPSITINSSATNGSLLVFAGSASGVPVNINYTAGHSGVQCLLGVNNYLGTITVNASTGSAPNSVSLIGTVGAFSTGFSYLNDGATATSISYVNKAPGLGYTPTTPSDWAVIPVNTQEALDELAGANVDAPDVNYSPTTPSDWPVSPPTNVQEALDTCGTLFGNSTPLNISWQGPFTTVQNGTMRYARIGAIVFLSFNPISGAATNGGVNITESGGPVLPLQYWPAGTVTCPVNSLITANTPGLVGSFTIDNTGAITITLGQASGLNFQTTGVVSWDILTGNSGWDKFTVCYIAPN